MDPVAEETATARGVVFVVGGNDEQRTELVDLLLRLGREIVCLESGEAMLQKAPRDRPFVLVTAAALPGVSPTELLGDLRRRGLPCPAILISDESDLTTAVEAMRAGASDFIERPFIDRVLLRRVRAALESAETAGQ